MQKLDKLEPEQIQGSCKFEPDEKEQPKEKQKQRNVHSDELELNGKQDSEKLEVVKYKQEKKREPNKLKPGEDQETNIPQSNTNLPLYTKESIYPEKLDSRNCTKDSESLECLLFQHQTQREASDEDGVSVNTKTEEEHNAVTCNSEQSTDTCIADKNLKDNDSLDKEKESVFCKDRRKENIYSKDKLEEDNVIIDKRVEESNSIDKKEEESFSKDKVEKDVFGIDKGEEENKKIYREENENAKVDTEKEILDNTDEWEAKLNIHKVEEEEDKSEKDDESLKKLEETEIPDGVCARHEIDLNCAPHYLEGGSTKCSSGNKELTSILNEEKECLPLIRPKNSQTDQSNQGTQNTYWDSFPSDSLDVNQNSHQEFSEKQIDSATILKGSESKQTFGVSAQDHRHEIVLMKEEEEQICESKRNLNNKTTDVESKSNSEENNQKEGLEAQEHSVMEDNINYNPPSEAVHSKEGIVKEQNSVHSNSSFPFQNEQRSVAQNKIENVDFLADNIANAKCGDMEESENAPISKKRHMIQHSSNFNVGNEEVEGMENLPVKETGSSERYEIKKQQSLDDGLKMESRSRKQSLPDSMIRSQGKKSKQFKRMNSDSAVMYEKSRYSLGILLEEINDLVRRTSSFECSDLDIRYKPTADKSSHRKIQQSAGKGNPGGKVASASGDENLLHIVEMYGDKQGKKPVDGSGGAAAASKVEYTANSPDGVFYDNENSEPREAEAQKSIIDNLDNVIGVSDSLNEFAKHTDGKNNSEMKRKAFCKKKSIGENSIKRYDDKKGKNSVDKGGSDNRPSDGSSSNCVAVSQLNLLKDETSDSSKVLEMKPPSVASKKEQRRRFPLRMLRRKSSVTSLSMLDVDEMADSSTAGTDVVPASTMTQDSQRRRKCSVVGYNDMGQGAGLLFQGGERATLRGEATHRKSSVTGFGRNGDGCTAAQSRRKSHQRNLSGNFLSFDTSSASKTSGTFSDLKGSSLIGRNPSLDNRCLKEDSISHLDRRASSQFEPSNFKQSTQKETSDTRKSISTKDYHRNDGSREALSLSNRHGRNSQDRRSSTYSQEHSKAIDGEKKQFPLLKDNASSSLSYCRELSSATDGGRKGQYPHSKTISTEGYSAFNKVGARGEMGNEKNRLTQYNQKLKGIAAVF